MYINTARNVQLLLGTDRDQGREWQSDFQCQAYRRQRSTVLEGGTSQIEDSSDLRQPLDAAEARDSWPNCRRRRQHGVQHGPAEEVLRQAAINVAVRDQRQRDLCLHGSEWWRVRVECARLRYCNYIILHQSRKDCGKFENYLFEVFLFFCFSFLLVLWEFCVFVGYMFLLLMWYWREIHELKSGLRAKYDSPDFCANVGMAITPSNKSDL